MVKKSSTEYLPLVKNSKTIIGSLIKIAIFLDFGNQVAAQNEVLSFYKRPLYKWKTSPLIAKNQDSAQVENDSNFIILYILSHLKRDRWRKIFWAYLQNFFLEGLKLNEVRDFKINDIDVLNKISNVSMFEIHFISGWIRIYEELNELDDLYYYLRNIKPVDINMNNIEAFLPYYFKLIPEQKKVVKNIIQKVNNDDFFSLNKKYIEKIKNEK